ncbi:hypothetical protein ACFQ1L_26740 [Phytohabitans flavus]|uniref:hypothetical protein n=1 Tax=Phytohabitans flavus TaxID=1076124 RepID=UPI0036282241
MQCGPTVVQPTPSLVAAGSVSRSGTAVRRADLAAAQRLLCRAGHDPDPRRGDRHPGRRIERVEFRERGTLLAVDTTAPYAFDWRGVPPNSGTRVTATAYDSAGASATAEVRGVRVLKPSAPGAAPRSRYRATGS